MVPSERKVTHTVLLFVFTVGGATLPQNLQGWWRIQKQAGYLPTHQFLTELQRPLPTG